MFITGFGSKTFPSLVKKPINIHKLTYVSIAKADEKGPLSSRLKNRSLSNLKVATAHYCLLPQKILIHLGWSATKSTVDRTHCTNTKRNRFDSDDTRHNNILPLVLRRDSGSNNISPLERNI